MTGFDSTFAAGTEVASLKDKLVQTNFSVIDVPLQNLARAAFVNIDPASFSKGKIRALTSFFISLTFYEILQILWTMTKVSLDWMLQFQS